MGIKDSQKSKKIICDKNCLECKFDDCINNDYDLDDFVRQKEEDSKIKKEFYNKKKQWDGQNEYSKRYYWEHRDKCLEKNRKYYATHKEKFKEYDRIRKKTHPVSKEKRHEYYIRWRDKKKAKQMEENKCQEDAKFMEV